MFLLKKVFQLREHISSDHEKPFLEHLEDLRSMIFRIVITLVLSMIVCFVFQEQLMNILRRPVEQVWVTRLHDQLPHREQDAPRPVDVDTWEKAKKLEHAAAALDPAQREILFDATGDDALVFHARAAALLRAALVLPEEKRRPFLDAADLPADLHGQVLALLETSPSPDIDSRGNLRMMSALKPTETFMLSMKLSFFAGIVLSFPLLLLFLLQFILPGLHLHERKVIWPALAVGFGLFLSGVAFAYFVVLPRALGFFFDWSGTRGVSNDWRIGEYITFATQFTLLFGLSFELPVVVMVIVKLGLLSYATMASTRRYAIIAIFVIAAILTPTPDILTLTLMGTPMVILYEICIWLAWASERRDRKREEAEDRERMDRLLLGYEEAEAVHAEETREAHDDGWDEQTPLPGDPGQDDSHPEIPEAGERHRFDP